MTHPKKPEVFVTRKLPAPVEARMQELFSVTLNRDDRRRVRLGERLRDQI